MNRRSFLKVLPLAASAPLALQACNTPVEPAANAQTSGDIAILSDSATLESRAIKTYDAAAASGLVTTPAVLDTVRLYRAHHLGHLNELNYLLRRFSQPQISLEAAQPFPQINDVRNEGDAVRLALELEYEAAAAYFRWASGIEDVTTPEVRRFVAETFPIEFAHFIELRAALGIAPPISSASFSTIPRPTRP